MSSSRKNILVGVTVLVGLILLGWMSIKFGNLLVRPFGGATLVVQITAPNAEGLSEGSAVFYRGINVGQVFSMNLAPDQHQVLLEARLDHKVALPANVRALIRSQGLIGSSASVFLDIPTGAQPEGQLQNGQQLTADVSGGGLLPKEFTELAMDLRQTSKQFRDSGLIQHLDTAITTIQQQVTRVGDAVQSMQTLVEDPKLRKDLQEAMSNFRAATESAKKAGQSVERFAGTLGDLSKEATDTIKQARGTLTKVDGNIDSVGKQVDQRLAQVGKILDSFQSVSNKLDKGQGSAGLLVNDPKFYQNLVDGSRQLTRTLADLQRLVAQWEQEGISFRLK